MKLSGFIKSPLFALSTLLILSWSAHADSPRVVSAKLIEIGKNTYRVEVTLIHADTGWEHYADKWEVMGPDDIIIAKRVLYHPHVDEQPFTRSLSGVKLGPNLRFVRIRPHDKQHGYGDISVYLPIPGREVPPKCRPDEALDLLKKE